MTRSPLPTKQQRARIGVRDLRARNARPGSIGRSRMTLPVICRGRRTVGAALASCDRRDLVSGGLAQTPVDLLSHPTLSRHSRSAPSSSSAPFALGARTRCGQSPFLRAASRAATRRPAPCRPLFGDLVAKTRSARWRKSTLISLIGARAAVARARSLPADTSRASRVTTARYAPCATDATRSQTGRTCRLRRWPGGTRPVRTTGRAERSQPSSRPKTGGCRPSA